MREGYLSLAKRSRVILANSPIYYRWCESNFKICRYLQPPQNDILENIKEIREPECREIN